MRSQPLEDSFIEQKHAEKIVTSDHTCPALAPVELPEEIGSFPERSYSEPGASGQDYSEPGTSRQEDYSENSPSEESNYFSAESQESDTSRGEPTDSGQWSAESTESNSSENS